MNFTVLYETDKKRKKKIRNSKDLAKIILITSDYEQGVYLENNSFIFHPYEEMENNNDWLLEYGLAFKEIDGEIKLYNLINNKIYED